MVSLFGRGFESLQLHNRNSNPRGKVFTTRTFPLFLYPCRNGGNPCRNGGNPCRDGREPLPGWEGTHAGMEETLAGMGGNPCRNGGNPCRDGREPLPGWEGTLAGMGGNPCRDERRRMTTGRKRRLLPHPQTSTNARSPVQTGLLCALLRRQDSNVRPPGYEPGELPTAPLRDIHVSFC